MTNDEKKRWKRKTVEEIVEEYSEKRISEGRHRWLLYRCIELIRAGADLHRLSYEANRLNERNLIPPLREQKVRDIVKWCLNTIKPRIKNEKANT